MYQQNNKAIFLILLHLVEIYFPKMVTVYSRFETKKYIRKSFCYFSDYSGIISHSKSTVFLVFVSGHNCNMIVTVECNMQNTSTFCVATCILTELLKCHKEHIC